jgi:hypothetical protein
MTTPEQATIKFSVPLAIHRELAARCAATGLTIATQCRLGLMLLERHPEFYAGAPNPAAMAILERDERTGAGG